MHGVKISIGYNSNKACTEFISFITKSTFSYLYLKELASQEADGNVKAIKSAFIIHDLHHLLQKMVFVASDGASLNSCLKGGIAAIFRDKEEISWLFFFWCLSYRLELAISDSLHEHLSSVKQFLISSMCIKYLPKN